MAEEELRKANCYWHVPYDLTEVRLEPEGEPYKVHTDEKDRCYVIADDGERTYIVFG